MMSLLDGFHEKTVSEKISMVSRTALNFDDFNASYVSCILPLPQPTVREGHFCQLFVTVQLLLCSSYQFMVYEFSAFHS